MSKNQIRASKYLSWSLYLTMPEYSLVSIVRNVYYICLCEASSSSRIRQPPVAVDPVTGAGLLTAPAGPPDSRSLLALERRELVDLEAGLLQNLR